MIVTLVVLAALLGLIPGSIAAAKGHDFLPWWFFGASLFIFALPAALYVPRNREGQRKCPACLSWVPAEATACAECGRDLPVESPIA